MPGLFVVLRQVVARIVFCLREDGYQGCLLIIVHTPFSWVDSCIKPTNKPTRATRCEVRTTAVRTSLSASGHDALVTGCGAIVLVSIFKRMLASSQSESHKRVWCVPDKYGQWSHREAVGAGLAQRQGDGLVSERSQFDSLLRLSFLF